MRPLSWTGRNEDPRVRRMAVRSGSAPPGPCGLDVHPRGHRRPLPPDERGRGPHGGRQRHARNSDDGPRGPGGRDPAGCCGALPRDAREEHRATRRPLRPLLEHRGSTSRGLGPGNLPLLAGQGACVRGDDGLSLLHDGPEVLPDRYVEGTCPHCGFPRARGDQCENCGRILDPFELKDPKCKIHGTTPIPKETKHFFFRLSAFEKPLSKWAADDKEHWRHHVLTFARSWLREGLKDRPITRDLDWGIEVPVPGYESKRIYVWFEAVMGYLTATKERYRRRNQPDGWKDFR